MPLPADITELQNHIRDCPLPELSNLESIEVELPETEKNGPLCIEFLRKYFPAAKIAILHLFSLKACKYKRKLNTPHLTSLSVYLDVDDNYSQWKNFCSILHASALSKLIIAFATNETITLRLIVLQKFPTLKYLRPRFNRKPKDFGFKILWSADVYFRTDQNPGNRIVCLFAEKNRGGSSSMKNGLWSSANFISIVGHSLKVCMKRVSGITEVPNSSYWRRLPWLGWALKWWSLTKS